jgi:hypothetical protein
MDSGKRAPKLTPALIEKRDKPLTHAPNFHSPHQEILRVPNIHTQASVVWQIDGSPKCSHRVVIRANQATRVSWFSNPTQDQSLGMSRPRTSPVKHPFKIKQ